MNSLLLLYRYYFVHALSVLTCQFLGAKTTTIKSLISYTAGHKCICHIHCGLPCHLSWILVRNVPDHSSPYVFEKWHIIQGQDSRDKNAEVVGQSFIVLMMVVRILLMPKSPLIAKEEEYLRGGWCQYSPLLHRGWSSEVILTDCHSTRILSYICCHQQSWR